MEELPSFLSSYGSCVNLTFSILFRFPYKDGLCRLLLPPAEPETFPTLSLQSLCSRMDPYPVVPLRCIYPLLRREHRLHVRRNTFSAPDCPCYATSAWNRYYEAAIIRLSSSFYTH